MPDVQGRCPACGAASLFLGEGGHVTCSRIDCPEPSAADIMLGQGAPMLHRVAVLASELFTAGALGPERETARKFLAVLQRKEPRLLDCGFCYEEQGEEVHPHPECPSGSFARQQPPVVATARVALDVAVTASDYALARAAVKPSAARDLAELQRRAARVTRKTDATVTVAPYGEGYEVTITRAGGTTRHGGYGFHAVQGMLLGVMTSADCLANQTPLRVRVATAIRPWLLGADEADVEAAVRGVLAALPATAAGVPVPQEAFDRLVRVAMWVSRGQSMAHVPDPSTLIGARYPDAAARAALGALDDAGLLDTYPPDRRRGTAP